MPDGLDIAWKFGNAGLSGASGWLFVHPFDLLKVQMQVSGTPSIALTAQKVYATGGLRGFYAGLNFALWRQMTYTTSRIGLYDTVSPMFADSSGKTSGIGKMAAGVVAGGMAATMCCPVEVGLVRAQADAQAPPELRRNYRGLFDAVRQISATEGVPKLWTGVGPTVARGAVVSMTQLASYEQAKEELQPYLGNGFPLFVASAMTSAVVYCTASLPLDICKTRIQNMKPDPESGKLPYNGLLHAMKKIPMEEGVLKLWTAFPAYFARSGGHTIAMFLFKEFYSEQYRNMRK